MDVRSNVVAAGLIAVMVLGSMVLWLVVPLAWLWLASQIDHSIQASMRAYAVIAFGVPTTMLALFWLLRRLDIFHQRVTGHEQRRKLAPAWRRSLSEERNLLSETSALDVILVATAIAALVTLVIWFLFIAGSSLPQ